MTYGEIVASIRAFNRREEQRIKERRGEQEYLAVVAYKLAALVNPMILEPKKAPTFEKAFPEWNHAKPDEAPAVPLWKRQQAGMAAYVAAYNAARKRKGR